MDPIDADTAADYTKIAAVRARAEDTYTSALLDIIEKCDIATSPAIEEGEKILMVGPDGTMSYTTKNACRDAVLGVWRAWFGGGK